MTRTCKFCSEAIEWISPTNATGYWRHINKQYKHIPAPAEVVGPRPNPADVAKFRETIDQALDLEVGPLLKEIVEHQTNMQNLWESGLLWLINASLLHPRGYALAAVFDDNDPNTVTSLIVVGDGSEPWCFGQDAPLPGDEFKTYESDKSYRNFAASEQKREREWSPKLNPPVTLDLRDPETERKFLLSLKEHGVGQAMVDCDFEYTANLDEIEAECIQKTIAHQLKTVHSELCMRFCDPGFPADYKFCYKPKNHEGGCVFSYRRRGNEDR